ncbi:transposase [Alkalibacter saccharofermentans]|uniref:transposase n=1 Tax=Alkalibacter saccharofermentans TaxID=235931 RepID=UPI0009335436|nr:transposase [Alkalibacter saccharofermentans]
MQHIIYLTKLLLALYCEKFQCSILSYCLMDTHVHIQLDPRRSDMSKFMHGINLCYAQYYNKSTEGTVMFSKVDS